MSGDQPMDVDSAGPSRPAPPRTPASPVSTAANAQSALDLAKSLRETALLSRKAKRRPVTESAPALLPRLDLGSTSMVLDYGEEDPDLKSHGAVPPVPPPPPEDDGPAREEGEISEPGTPPHAKARDAMPVDAPSLASRLSDRLDSALTDPKLDERKPSPPAPVTANLSTNSPKENSTAPDPTVNVADDLHVPPGLSLTKSQYGKMQDIVLDLLGWGVHPEYLADCGVSREVIFHVFTDLNLRLPANLDTSGLEPFVPPGTVAARMQSEPAPPTPSSPREPPAPVRNTQRGSLSHPSLPPKPSDPQGIAPSRVPAPLPPPPPLIAPMVPSPTRMTDSLAGGLTDLQDMEQQRRRTLLARKEAAQALRKAKESISASKGQHLDALGTRARTEREAPVVLDSDMENKTVAHETVDDFLKSISGSDLASANSESERKISDAGMDIDSSLAPPITLSPHRERIASPVSETSLEPQFVGEPADLAESHLANSSHFSGPFDSNEGDAWSPKPARNGAPVHRRGSKRPVAADFVDFDGGDPGQNGNGLHHGAGYLHRNGGSFASVSGMRRCVIDLSDSEPDDDHPLDDLRTNGRSLAQLSTLARMGGGGLSRMVASTSSGMMTPPLNGNGNSPRLASASPAALVEKELEIKRMRELIAKREQERLRKQVIISRSTPVTPVPSLPATVLTVEHEDDDAAGVEGLDAPSLPPTEPCTPEKRRTSVVSREIEDINMQDPPPPPEHEPQERAPSPHMLASARSSPGADPRLPEPPLMPAEDGFVEHAEVDDAARIHTSCRTDFV